MIFARTIVTTVGLLLAGASMAAAQQCGGNFDDFLQGVRKEAAAEGISQSAIDRAVADMHIDRKVLAADRAQNVFTQTWKEFAGRMASNSRLSIGRKKLKQYASAFRKIEAETGVPGPVITSFWGLETDFGAVLGSFDTLSALATLAHDCRRPELFRPQLIAAIRLVEAGDLTPQQMHGAWAGELGQTQMLPRDYLKFGVDANGNGKVDLLKDEADVLATTGRFIQSLGWHAAEPWLEEVKVPSDFPWERAGLVLKAPRSDFAKLGVTRRDGSRLPSDALSSSLILPMGRKGPAFLAYPNFGAFLEWNKSLTYSLTAAYLATRLAGAPAVDMGSPEPGLSLSETKRLQQDLAAKGYDVGEVDGILGENTRDAVRQMQQKLGLAADGWPTKALLSAMK